MDWTTGRLSTTEATAALVAAGIDPDWTVWQAADTERAESVLAAAVATKRGTPDPTAYSVSPARYAKGMLLVRITSEGAYKTRAARLIGDGLKARWTNRCGGYVASPAKVAKFERLYAQGWDAAASPEN
jgi:hypothetical protein